MLLLVFTVAACETDEPEPVTPPANQPVNTLSSDIDTRLNQVDQDVAALQGRVATMAPEVREAVDGILAKVQEEQEDLMALRAEAAQATEPDEIAEARLKMREEHHDIRTLLMEARIEAADERAELLSELNEEAADLDREISELEAESAEENAELQQEYNEQLAELRQQREALQQNLQQAEQATEQNWEEARREIAEGWRSFSRSVGDALTPGSQ